MVGDPDTAQDLVQDVFVRAWQGLERFRWQSNTAFSTWLFQIARNAALDSLRHRKRHPTTPLSAAFNDAHSIPAKDATASDAAASHETGAQIAAAIAALPEDQRTAIILAEYHGLSCPDIAAVMKWRLYRARLYLRERLSHLLA
jgi:RNA polymerase sigma-70 factor (ECF subfamily)